MDIISFFKRKDAIVSLGMLGFAALIYTQTFNLPEESADFPRLIATVSGFLGFFQLIVSRKSGQKKQDTSNVFNFRLIAFFLILIVSVSLIKILGFYSSLFIVMFAVNIMCFSINPAGLKTALISSAVAIVILFILFDMVLAMPVEAGIFI